MLKGIRCETAKCHDRKKTEKSGSGNARLAQGQKQRVWGQAARDTEGKKILRHF